MELTKEFLERIYRLNNNKILCEKLGITAPTLSVYLDKFQIKRKKRGRKKNSTKIKLILDE